MCIIIEKPNYENILFFPNKLIDIIILLMIVLCVATMIFIGIEKTINTDDIDIMLVAACIMTLM